MYFWWWNLFERPVACKVSILWVCLWGYLWQHYLHSLKYSLLVHTFHSRLLRLWRTWSMLSSPEAGPWPASGSVWSLSGCRMSWSWCIFKPEGSSACLYEALGKAVLWSVHWCTPFTLRQQCGIYELLSWGYVHGVLSTKQTVTLTVLPCWAHIIQWNVATRSLATLLSTWVMRPHPTWHPPPNSLQSSFLACSLDHFSGNISKRIFKILRSFYSAAENIIKWKSCNKALCVCWSTSFCSQYHVTP